VQGLKNNVKNEKLNTIWNDTTKQLKKLLNEETYAQWIIPVLPISYNGKEFVVGVSDEFFLSWLQHNFGEIIANSISKVAGQKIDLKFEVGHTRPEEATPREEKPKKAQKSKKAQKRTPKNCHNRHTFNNFVVGPENEFAVTAAKSILKADGPSPANPLFIYGGTGLGKTHILQAVAHEAAEKNPNAVIEYLSCEEFLNLYLESLNTKMHARFRNRFRKADYLLIDDIHFIAKKTSLQEEFFNTFNNLYNADKKILLTSDRRPSEINHLEDRLVSRFDSGLTVDIQPLGVETRMAILQKKQEEHLIKIDNNILFFIADKITSNVRRLEGALTRLLTFLSMKGGKLTLDDTERILAPMLEDEVSTLLTVETIQKTIADHFDLKVADLTGNKRPRNIAVPRMMAMYFARKMTDKSLPEIGSCFGKNHATVLHAVREMDKRQKTDNTIKHTLSLLERQLQNA
jgi:chromosomal replication initiator protein